MIIFQIFFKGRKSEELTGIDNGNNDNNGMC